MSDFTKKQPPKSPVTGREEIKIDHETGNIHVPGVGPLPLVGPTSGSEYKDLKEKEAEFSIAKTQLERLMKHQWKCIQCKRVWPGTRVRVKKATKGSEQVLFVCPDRKCDAPVIMLEAGVRR